MIYTENTFDSYITQLNTFDNLMAELAEKKKTYIIPKKIESDLDDLFNLVLKFKELKTIINNTNFKKTTLIDVNTIIDYLIVLEKNLKKFYCIMN